MKKNLVICFFIILFIMASCQPNPSFRDDKNIKNNGNDKEELTEYFDKVSLSDGIELNINATVRIPNVDNHKTAIVNKMDISAKKPQTEDLIQKVYNVLIGGKDIYLFKETQEELENYLNALSIQKVLAKEYLNNYDNEAIEFVTEDIINAINKNKFDMIKGDISNILDYPDACVQSSLGREKPARLQVITGKRNVISLSNPGFKVLDYKTHYNNEYDEETIINKAYDILDKIGIRSEFDLVKIKKEPIDYTIIDMSMDDIFKPVGIALVFTRNINGQEQLYYDLYERGTWNNQYNGINFFEFIYMQFDEDGLSHFIWEEPSTIETKDEVQIIEFNNAMDIMRQHMERSQNKYLYELYDTSRIKIYIDDIRLGMTCVIRPNDIMEAIPMWEFYGYITYTDNSGNIKYIYQANNEILDEKKQKYSLCAIDAISGKIIDRSLGY